MIRNLVIYLVISGTLVSSLAVTGQVYASLNKLPDTNIGPEVGTEDEDQATDEDDEDQDDNETTSEAPAASQNRFCVDGTGGSTGRACIPCDPGLKFEVGCTDVLTGGPLDTETATSESGKGKAIGELKPQIAEMLQGTDNTAEKAKIIFKNLEDQGKVPPKTTEAVNSFLTGNAEESRKALGTLCNILSTDKSSNLGKIDCSVLEDLPTNDTTTIANKPPLVDFPPIFRWLLEEVLDGTIMTPDEIGAYCKNNPGACN